MGSALLDLKRYDWIKMFVWVYGKKIPMENTKITKGKLINYTMILNNLKVGENFNILTSKF